VSRDVTSFTRLSENTSNRKSGVKGGALGKGDGVQTPEMNNIVGDYPA
jgi:hypothetical protein